MDRPLDTSAFASEFDSELENERQQLLRRRFLWYTGTVLFLSVFSLIFGIFGVREAIGASTRNGAAAWITLFVNVAVFALFCTAFSYVFYHKSTRWPLLKMVFWLIVITGSLNLLTGSLAAAYFEEQGGAKIRVVPAKGPVEISTDSTPSSDAPEKSQAVVNPRRSSTDADAVASKVEEAIREGVEGSTSAPSADRDDSRARDQRVIRTFSVFGAALAGLASVFSTHFFACLFLPLTPRECIRPLIPLLALNALLTIAYVIFVLTLRDGGWGVVALGLAMIAFSPIIGMPGYFVIWWRDSRFREGFTNRVLRGRYNEMRRELVDARRIHESLFPRSVVDGPLHFRYAYEPMRQIGGDYLFSKLAHMEDGRHGILNLVVLDVTGHGIPAALTVNRLHGELERIFAEHPAIGPHDLLHMLNRYVHLTLSSHWVYVTALCIKADSRDSTVEYASAGHPPAFLYTADGRLEELESTAMILGACGPDEFDAHAKTFPFGLGDRIIAYTDGAFECRDRNGQQLRISGIRRLLARGPGEAKSWPESIIRAVADFRHGPPPDDTLVIEISRPVSASFDATGRFLRSASSQSGRFAAIRA
ncbi:MAG: SpoIIE family protein phosphatase [Planctomycetes bacterium]|nr:SpoIIE family protein phosphatase [Planctomycetota bacterium]